MNLHLRLISKYYYSFGFNITGISDYLFDKEDRNSYFEYEKKENNEVSYKSPDHKWFHLKVKRQTEEEIENYSWEYATGIGTVLGFNKLRAIDVDGFIDENSIYRFLEFLKLPLDYEWVVKSGSGNGFHIIFYCPNHEYPVSLNQNKAFKSKIFESGELFDRLELRWCGHLVLPPSNHRNGIYSFLSQKIPINPPKTIQLEDLNYLINVYCLDEQVKGASGTFLDYGHSKLSHNISIINENLSLIYKNPFTLIFSCSTTNITTNNSQKNNDIEEKKLSRIEWRILDSENELIEYCNFLIKPYNYDIPQQATDIHGISHNIAYEHGKNIEDILIAFRNRIEISDYVSNNDLSQDIKTLKSEYEKMGIWDNLSSLKSASI